MGLFGPPDVAKLKAKRDVDGLLKASGYQKDPNVRRAAAEALGELRDARAVGCLTVMLKDGSSSVRRDAATALGLITDLRAAVPLTLALQDQDKSVREAAAEALTHLSVLAPHGHATDQPLPGQDQRSSTQLAVGDIVTMDCHYEFSETTGPVLLAGPDRGMDGTEWRVQRIAAEPGYARVDLGVMQITSEPHVELVLVAGRYEHWSPVDESELPTDFALAAEMRANGKTVAEQPGYTMTWTDSNAYRRHFPGRPANQEFFEEWKRLDRRSAGLIKGILAHPSPVVFGAVNKDVQAYLDELQRDGDAAVQPTLSALTACAAGDSGGAYWWNGGQELCALLGRVGSPEAEGALLQILETVSRIVEWEYVRASAARALAAFEDPQLLPRLLRCLELSNAPVLAIARTIVTLGGDPSSLPTVILAQGRDIRDLREAVRFYCEHQPQVAAWPSSDEQGGFFYFFGKGVERLHGTDAARPLLAASLAANPAANSAAWVTFPSVPRTPHDAQALAQQYPLTADYLASVDAPDERPAEGPLSLAEQAQSEKWQLRCSYAEDPQAAPEKLEDLIRHDPVVEVRNAACANPNTAPRVLEEFGSLGSSPLTEIVAAMRRRGREKGLWDTIAANPNAPLPVLERLASLEASEDALRQVAASDRADAAFFVERILWGVAENPNTPAVHLERLAKDPNYRIRIRVTGNPSTPLRALQTLARDPEERIRKAAKENPFFRPAASSSP